jgi:hypothetical protein
MLGNAWKCLEMLLCQNYAVNFIVIFDTMERVKRVVITIICLLANIK